jgi:hypothetical protein
MKPVASDLAGILEGAGLSLARPPTSPANLFTAPLPEPSQYVADKAVSVLLYGGDPPLPYVGGGKKALRTARCQVTVRSPRNDDLDAGQTLANACLDALNQATHASYVSIRAEQSVANYLAPRNRVDQHFWTFTVAVIWAETPT